TAIAVTTHYRPSLRNPNRIDQTAFLKRNLLPATLAAGAFIELGASNSGLAFADTQTQAANIALCALVGAAAYAVSWVVARPRQGEARDFGLWTVSGLVFGALLGTGASVYHHAPTDGHLLFNDLLLPVMFGVPWVLLALMAAETIFVGLSSYQRGVRPR